MDVGRGEIIKINLNPTEGREQQGNARPCLVISQTQYNQRRCGMAIVMPITKTIKPEVKIMIPLPSDIKIKGSVIVEQIRTVDLSKRWWKTTGVTLPQTFVDQLVNTFGILIGLNNTEQ